MEQSDPLELPEQARCPRCGYSIHALTTDRCPECGTGFDRARVLASLTRAKLPLDATAEWMLSPPSWWLVLFATAGAVINISTGSIYRDASADPPILLMVADVVSSILILKIVDRLRVGWRYQIAAAVKRRFSLKWLLVPILAACCFPSLGGSTFGTRVMFFLSWPEMHVLANRVIASQTFPPDRQVGLFSACFISPTASGMNFRLKQDVRVGFACTTTGGPPGNDSETEWLGGDWYYFRKH